MEYRRDSEDSGRSPAFLLDMEGEKKCWMSKNVAGREGEEAKMDIEGKKKCQMSKREQESRQ